jgi:nucleoside-diphosphate-sugar epimerase
MEILRGVTVRHRDAATGWREEIVVRRRSVDTGTHSKSAIVYRPLPPDDPKQRKPDITLARTLLGWEPKIGREEGLKLTLDYFRTKV